MIKAIQNMGFVGNATTSPTDDTFKSEECQRQERSWYHVEALVVRYARRSLQDLRFNFGNGVEFRCEAADNKWLMIMKKAAQISSPGLEHGRSAGLDLALGVKKHMMRTMPSCLQDFPELYQDPDAGPLYASPWSIAASFRPMAR